MWQQDYTPLADSLSASSLVAALPIFVLLLMLGVLRKPAWVAGLCGLATAVVVGVGVYGMPIDTTVGAMTYGAAFPHESAPTKVPNARPRLRRNQLARIFIPGGTLLAMKRAPMFTNRVLVGHL